MEAYLILIHIVLFSSDNTHLDNKTEVENCQTYYMLFLHRYLTDLYGTEVGRMKLSQIMGCLVDLRELCEKSQNEQENIRLWSLYSVPHISLIYLSYLSGLAVSPELGSYQLTIIAQCRGMIIWAIVKRYWDNGYSVAKEGNLNWI